MKIQWAFLMIVVLSTSRNMKSALLLFALTCCFLTVYGEACAPTSKAKYINDCGWSETSRTEILNAHNERRNFIASGKHESFEKAENMRKLSYDKELESGAKKHVDMCLTDHSSPAAGSYGKNYGQSLFWSMSKNKKTKLNSSEPVYDWFNEIDAFISTGSDVNSYLFDSDTGHFTQDIWAETEKVGCYCARFEKTGEEFPYYLLVTCNYAPGGNAPGSPIYKQGEPCKKCKCADAPYSSLCVDKPTV